jgi:hypothetical protein
MNELQEQGTSLPLVVPHHLVSDVRQHKILTGVPRVAPPCSFSQSGTYLGSPHSFKHHVKSGALAFKVMCSLGRTACILHARQLCFPSSIVIKVDKREVATKWVRSTARRGR